MPHEEIQDVDGTRRGRLCEEVTSKEKGVLVWGIPDRRQKMAGCEKE